MKLLAHLLQNVVLATYGVLYKEAKSATYTRLSEVIGISHDGDSLFLGRKSFEPIGIFNQSKDALYLHSNILNVDDSVLDKPYVHHVALASYFYSGKYHKSVYSINFITLYYIDKNGLSIPVTSRFMTKHKAKPSMIIFWICYLK